MVKFNKEKTGNGCRVRANGYIEPLNNQLTFRSNYGTRMVDITNQLHMRVIDQNKNKSIDFSHVIHEFQFGRSVSSLNRLEKKFPDMIKANSLNGVEYVSKSIEDGHSLFLYEVNIVNTKIGFFGEVMYNYNKNTINDMNAIPFVNFKLNFSPIAIEYIEGGEGFWEFLAYLLGVVGGVLSIVKFFANVLAKWKSKECSVVNPSSKLRVSLTMQGTSQVFEMTTKTQ